VSAPEQWSGKRVLVTGHTGFKGAWLCHLLLRSGAEVLGYSLPPPHEPSLFALTHLDEHVRHQEGDVRDLESLRRAGEAFQPEVAFHLAAQSLVLESYQDPVGTFATNVLGTVNVLEALRGVASLGACVVVTSDKCYEDRGSTRPHHEDDRLGGEDPYSASKAAAEIVTSAYRASFFGSGARVASARAGNVIGGGDWSDDRLVPDVVRALTGATEGLELRRPDAVRPWQHVLEPLSGYLRLAEQLVSGDGFEQGWNFGPEIEEPWSVQDLVTRFLEAWGPAAAARITVTHSAWKEASYLSLDSSSAREHLGWRPRWGVRAAIERTVAWYRAFYDDGASALALVEADCEAYELAADPREPATEAALRPGT
jgi:CDP-glucose 4,6-dehydratase